MKKYLPSIVLGCAVIFSAFGAHAEILNFDSYSGNGAPIADGYGGLNWTGFGALDNTFDGAHSVSGSEYAYGYCCGSDDKISVATGRFDLINGYFSEFGAINTPYTLTGFLGATALYHRTLSLGATPTLVTLNFIGIDSVVFSASTSGNLVFDDLQVTTAAVPEPASISLIGLALFGFAASRRKAGRQNA